MSTSLLYHAFGIRGYEYVRTGEPSSIVVQGDVRSRERISSAMAGVLTGSSPSGT
jgi:hypothetical protein